MAIIKTRSFIEDLRRTLHSFWDKDNCCIRTEVENIFTSRKLSEDRKRLIKRFCVLLMDTDFIRDSAVKEYLCSLGETYEDVGKRLNVNPDRIKRRVFYYCSMSDKYCGKIPAKFGETFLTEILTCPGQDISQIEQAINREYVRCCGIYNPQDEILLSIPHGSNTKQSDDAEFERFISVISPYIKLEMDRVKNSLTAKQCGYFWYLVNNQYDLSGVDYERFTRLKTICSETQNTPGV